MPKIKLSLGTALAISLVPSLALGSAPAKEDAEAASENSAQELADEEYQKRRDIPWIRRWAPEKGVGEIGLYGGLFFTSPNHELYQAELGLPFQGWKPLRTNNATIGARAAYYPLAFLGIEMEGGIMPLAVNESKSSFPASGGKVSAYAIRGSIVGQLTKSSLTPFILIGAGALGVSSDRSDLGKDVDPALHYGAGVKFFLNRYTMLRLDFRNIVSYGVDVGENFSDPGTMELLLGLSVTLGREKRQGPRVEEAVVEIPEPVNDDQDGDGFPDEVDACPEEPGVEPDGCPLKDADGDGILDPDDKCPDVAGLEEYEGCPIPDEDGDGISDPDDKCPKEPETANSYLDDDGCPDQLPEEMKRFSGVVEGITFETDQATIKASSAKILKKALKVLKIFPDVNLVISGHTDSRGDRVHNMLLSRRRAEAVKEWLVKRGIEASRIKTEGFGADQPIDTNDTKEGRSRNRRIEFQLN